MYVLRCSINTHQCVRIKKLIYNEKFIHYAIINFNLKSGDNLEKLNDTSYLFRHNHFQIHSFDYRSVDMFNPKSDKQMQKQS